mgnify:CR=1 FL=1
MEHISDIQSGIDFIEQNKEIAPDSIYQKIFELEKDLDQYGELLDSLINNKHYAIKTMNSKNLLNKNYIIALTSGSTGDPKPIILSQKTKILRSLYTKKLYNLNRKSVVIASTPLYHTLAQRLIILPIMMGGRLMQSFCTQRR